MTAKEKALVSILNITSINFIELMQPDESDPNKKLHLILEDGAVTGFVVE